MSKILIDGDSFCYIREAFIESDSNIPLQRVDALLKRILYDNNYQEYEGYLGQGKTFRHELYPEYKSNRMSEKPFHYNTIKKYLVYNLGFNIVHNVESDDMISLRAKELKEYVICHIDSDLNQIPGLHYNFRERYHYTMKEEDCIKLLYKSILKGGHNNIKGIKGIGDKKAEVILSRSKYYMLESILEYNKHYGISKGWKEFYKNYVCNKLL